MSRHSGLRAQPLPSNVEQWSSKPNLADDLEISASTGSTGVVHVAPRVRDHKGGAVRDGRVVSQRDRMASASHK